MEKRIFDTPQPLLTRNLFRETLEQKKSTKHKLYRVSLLCQQIAVGTESQTGYGVPSADDDKIILFHALHTLKRTIAASTRHETLEDIMEKWQILLHIRIRIVCSKLPG